MTSFVYAGARQKITIFVVINLLIAGYLGYALVAPASSIKTTLLPGTTTHGHYQIELDCNACHARDMSFIQDSCVRCHADELKLAGDTHPASKFNDPANAELLRVLDAQKCVTCHSEHVPEQTRPIGVTLPLDYCWHCHQDVADNRPSHRGMTFDSCATVGCHNYHDNSALYEKFLDSHHGESERLETRLVRTRDFSQRWRSQRPDRYPLLPEHADNPVRADNSNADVVERAVVDWADTGHAASGVNCSECHQSDSNDSSTWSDQVEMAACGNCHQAEVETFGQGRHGMRLAAGMSPMQPKFARLSMHSDAAHRELTCNACHPGHRFDTRYAAVQACLNCHADSHSSSYQGSGHAVLWQKELAGELPADSGVSCATCHLPRIESSDATLVTHHQNFNLRPIEKMIRSVCGNCHGLQFSLDSLADPELSLNCYSTAPSRTVESIDMAHRWFEAQSQKRSRRKQP